MRRTVYLTGSNHHTEVTTMTNTAAPTHVRITGSDDAPAVWREGWLPDDSPFPELTELRETYLRIRGTMQDASAEVWRIRNELEAAGKRREAAMRDAVLAGADAEVEDNTAELEQQLAQARAQANAAAGAMVEHINTCITTVLEHRDDWLDKCRRAEAGLEIEAEDLQKRLRAKLREKGKFFRLEHWVGRMGDAAVQPAWHFAYADIVAPPRDEAEAAEQLQEHMLRSYAGSPAGATRISDEESRRREGEAMRPPQMDEAELAKLNDTRGATS